MKVVISYAMHVEEIYRRSDMLGIFIRFFLISFLMLLSLASYGLFKIMATASGPFIYAGF